MSRVLVDTSALIALLVPSDRQHPRAKKTFTRLRAQEAVLVTTSYVVLETYALIGRRLGLDAVRVFRDRFAPLLEVIWVDALLHEAALDLVLTGETPGLSLADAASVVAARRDRLDEVFAFDPHLERAGLQLAR